MTLSLDRIAVEGAGDDPVALARAVHGQLPDLKGAVPVYDIALALDIEEIRAEPLTSFEGCLHHGPAEEFRGDPCQCGEQRAPAALHRRPRTGALL